MFHCFIVREDHRNYLRFLWHRDSDTNKEMIEYRMRVHVFGNSPSPAVATYGLRRTASDGESEFGKDARHFVEKDFYVDDALKSLPTAEEAIDLLRRTQGMLSRACLRLHKIDAPLPHDKQPKWESWKESLHALDRTHIPRCYTPASLTTSQRREVHIFSDASTEAIAAVAYLKVIDNRTKAHVGFLFGKAKLAPKPEHTIPRLELCGAVLAVEIADFIQYELDIHVDDVQFYTDSKVVLGYINNQTKRFYVYVSNRVERIRKSSKPEQWHYVPSHLNPADCATRPSSVSAFAKSSWLTGPEFLLNEGKETSGQDVFNLQDPDNDPEIRPEVSTLITRSVRRSGLDCHRFERFSRWLKLVRTIARPLVPVSVDPDSPAILTPATLLTQNLGSVPSPPEELSSGNIYRKQWKHVQHLANCFWSRWKKEYLALLQGRRKWQQVKPNLQVGDVVLMKDQKVERNAWPMGLISKIFPSEDGRVRKVEVTITRQGDSKTFIRPVSETVLLLPVEE
ncbi:uncharacterized protein RB166_001498 [Leptodactylus fuscus]